MFAFVLALFYTSAMEPEANVGELSSLDVITQAHLRGELDAETSLVYRVWAVLDPQRLPPRFQSQPRRFLKSLTPLLLEVRTHWDSLSPRAKAMLAPYLLRPTEPGQEPFPYGHSYLVPAVYYDSPGGHFRIWYVTSTRDSPAPVYTHGDTIPDWIDTLAWMRENLPQQAVVASWWDYGYWITIWGNKTSLADNGTSNGTQIENVGYMFMSNETEAIKMLENYDATHVLVFTTFYTDGRDGGFGDEGKWRWMARIAAERYPSINETDYGDFNEQTGTWEWNDLGASTVIYKLMTYGKKDRLPDVAAVQQLPLESLQHFEKAYFSQDRERPDSLVAYGGIIPLVCVYEVKYD